VPIDAFAQLPWYDGRGRLRGAKYKNRLKRERMTNTKLTHYAIRTTDLEVSRRFYTEVMGFRFGYRPPPRSPGIWLYPGEDQFEFGIVHIIDVKPDLVDPRVQS
jgi:Glyoxalase/Bleomycin resistance protein/Dioxygenase superfamily